MPTMRTIWEAKRQLLELLGQAGFPEESMIPMRIDPNQDDPQLDLVRGLLVAGLYPNVCYHKEKRKVLTTESKAALIHKTSVNCTNLKVAFPYPFFVFGEKIRTKCVACKQMSMVTPLHLLLFGCKKVDFVDGKVRLDNWIILNMDPNECAIICGLRKALEEILLYVVSAPEDLLNLEENYAKVLGVIRNLCEFPAGDFEIDRNQEGGVSSERLNNFGGGFNSGQGNYGNSSGGSGFGGGKFSRNDGGSGYRGGYSGGSNNWQSGNSYQRNNYGGGGRGGYNNRGGYRGGRY